MNIQLLRADINSLKVDALVAPADQKAHDRPAEDTGRAVVVTGGNLLARFIIHVHVPNVTDDDADAKLRAATLAALDRAEELAIASIGLPAIATEPFGFSTEHCARVMLAATLQHRTRARSLQRAVFCLFGAEEYAVFERVLGELNH
ncbi:MAG TPA: macro domain-containing protein [Thermoanaerobaculia bacterium]|nr:macro domain-containing protein [Thermoanaerobaculia bacterium]